VRKVTRQIYFYDINLQKYNEENGFEVSKKFGEDLKYIFNKFNDLPFDKGKLNYSRYLKKANGTYDFIEIDEITDNVIKGKLINVDDSGLTYYEEQGMITLLKETLSESASVAEISHFIICLDSQIMAFEYNAKSSRAPSLANYIKEKLKMEYYIEFKNLINKNKKILFNSITHVKEFEFTTSSKLLLSSKATKDGFFCAADAALALTNNETDVEQTITIKVKPKRITKKNKQPYYDAEKLKKSINEMNFGIDEPEKYFKLDIVGVNELNEKIAVNYTNDLITSSIILGPNEKYSSDFYEKIEEAYNKVYNKYIR